MTPFSYKGISMNITELKGIGEKTEKLFQKVGVFTVEDLIRYYPVNYDEYTAPVSLNSYTTEKKCAVYGMLAKELDVKKIRNLTIATTSIRDDDNTLILTWFNMPYLRNQLKKGSHYVFRGRIQEKKGRLVMEQPEIFSLPAYEEKLHTLQPIYSLTKGLTNSGIQKAMKQAFLKMGNKLTDSLPEEIRDRYQLMGYQEAVAEIHFPQNMETLIRGRRRLVFEEFLEFLIGIRKMKESQAVLENSFPIKEKWVTEDIIENLPYKLTNAQMRTWMEIERDLCGRRLMSRLVQGDVGSGKTILAFLSMILTVSNGYQSALMVPTEVLAKQHYEGLQKLLAEQGLEHIKPVLLTGSLTAAQKRKVYEQIGDGSAQIIIGTHALIQEKVQYQDLALVITDEQHRFGVRQREALASKGKTPNILVMSATPIPRTLAIILYGDLDISVLDELPAARLPIKNCVVDTSYRGTAYKFMKKQIEEGRQVYIICPMVEESEESDGENVIDYGTRMKQEFDGIASVGILHGQMKQSLKNEIMEAFAANEIQILVSTTVVEVGVDVPNASVMMIENADRFGLAQLHQLRGRVGRGKWQSYCIFMQSEGKKEKSKRLEILNKSNDGFRIAEEDLKLRGPGDFFGIRQSGEMEFALADIIQDAEVLKQAAEAAPYMENIIKESRGILL